VSVAAHC